MKRIFGSYTQALLMLLPALLVAFSSCNRLRSTLKGEGDAISQTLDLKGFTQVTMSVPGHAYITQGDSFKVEVIGQANVLEVLKAAVQSTGSSSANLTFTFTKTVKSLDTLAIYITMPDVRDLVNTNKGDIHAQTDFATETFSVSISGSGNAYIKRISATTAQALLSGSGALTVNAGVVSEATLSVSGSGGIEMSNVRAQSCTATISGSGNIRISPVQTLTATISGSGNIEYKGSPVVTQTITGSGTVRKI